MIAPGLFKGAQMRIRMAVRAAGTEDGFTPRTFEAGKEYDVGEDLAASFIAEGLAAPVKPAGRAKAAGK